MKISKPIMAVTSVLTLYTIFEIFIGGPMNKHLQKYPQLETTVQSEAKGIDPMPNPPAPRRNNLQKRAGDYWVLMYKGEKYMVSDGSIPKIDADSVEVDTLVRGRNNNLYKLVKAQ